MRVMWLSFANGGRPMALAAVMLALSSCQPPSFDLVPELVGGRLVLRPVDPTGWPDAWNMKGVNAADVTFSTRKETLWLTRLHDVGGACDRLPDPAPFPLTYGQTPRCFRNQVAAKPLPQGEWIKVSTYGFRSSINFIQIVGNKVERRDWRDEDAPNEDWDHADQAMPGSDNVADVAANAH